MACDHLPPSAGGVCRKQRLYKLVAALTACSQRYELPLNSAGPQRRPGTSVKTSEPDLSKEDEIDIRTRPSIAENNVRMENKAIC